MPRVHAAPPFTEEEWEVIVTAMNFYVEACQMGRGHLAPPDHPHDPDCPGHCALLMPHEYRYWKDVAPLLEAVQQMQRGEDRHDTGLRERLGL